MNMTKLSLNFYSFTYYFLANGERDEGFPGFPLVFRSQFGVIIPGSSAFLYFSFFYFQAKVKTYGNSGVRVKWLVRCSLAIFYSGVFLSLAGFATGT